MGGWLEGRLWALVLLQCGLLSTAYSRREVVLRKSTVHGVRTRSLMQQENSPLQGNANNSLPQDILVPKIIGGSEANIEDYSFLASLRIPKGAMNAANEDIGGRHYCAGSLITKNVLLTAAHCVNRTVLRTPDVYFNITQVNGSNFQAFRPIETRIHPEYSRGDAGSLNYDAALLVLNGEPDVATIPLKDSEECFNEGSQCAPGIVLGWGFTREGDRSSGSGTLHSVKVPLVSRKKCREQITKKAITDAMVCAGEEGKDACQNDSGGPLLVGEQLAGIVSWGVGCGRAGLAGVYTNVAFLNNWLQEQLKDIENSQEKKGEDSRKSKCVFTAGHYIGIGCKNQG